MGNINTKDMDTGKDLAESRQYEMQTYLHSLKALYENSVLQNGEVYDIAFHLTKGFARIDAKSILEDSRIIRILRYAMAPAISQMKFGQFFGIASIDRYENSKVSCGTTRHRELSGIAGAIAEFATNNLDKARFIWLDDRNMKTPIACSYAKNWTCSMAASQNAQTAYRNWRRVQQEQAIVSRLVSWGYIKSGFTGIIKKNTDINIGEYRGETRVKGRTNQKADVVFRSKKTRKLVLIEAKAVGVEIDATKRIKECCDKAHDWSSSGALCEPDIVAVIAGYFSSDNISNLQTSNIFVVWEHRLGDLKEKA